MQALCKPVYGTGILCISGAVPGQARARMLSNEGTFELLNVAIKLRDEKGIDMQYRLASLFPAIERRIATVV